MSSLTPYDPTLFDGLSDHDAIDLMGKYHALRIAEARERADAFVEYAIPHELTADPIQNSLHHIEWHDHLDKNQMGIIFAPVEHGKSQQVAVGRVIWALGNNPRLRIGLISNTSTQAEKLLSSISAHILRNPRVRQVFPHLEPSKFDRWTNCQITVARDTIAKDPSISALGAGGPVVGSRLDIIVVDDLLDFENTRTPEQMSKLLEWYETTLFTRLTPGGKIWIIGTPWHPDDLLHTLAARPGYASMRHSAVLNPDDAPGAWKPLWPEQFPRERLAAIQTNTSAHNFNRKYLCRVRDDANARFQMAWIDNALGLGQNRILLPKAPMEPGGRILPCFTGVDLGIGEKDENAKTVIFTIAIDERNRRIVADIQGGQWQAPEIIQRIREVYRRYNSIIFVESNQAQRFLVQFAQQGGIPVTPFHTGKNKWDEHFGVESLAVELKNAMWVIPSGQDRANPHPEIKAWIKDMLNYSPSSHTGDYLMASWFAREGARQHMFPMQQRLDTMSR